MDLSVIIKNITDRAAAFTVMNDESLNDTERRILIATMHNKHSSIPLMAYQLLKREGMNRIQTISEIKKIMKDSEHDLILKMVKDVEKSL